MTVRLVTIGVYGYDEASFFAALKAAGVDTFVDIRQRRGLRGAAYAFANSQRLQARLAELNVRYLHRKDLAPTPAVRARQAAADKTEKVAKRQRTTLSQAFIEAYETEVLVHFDPASLRDELGSNAHVVALFCVERDPTACHRSLVANKLFRAYGWRPEHLSP